MKLLEFLKRERKKSASVAKERLQIIVAHQRSQRDQPDYMPMLELLELLRDVFLVKSDHAEKAISLPGLEERGKKAAFFGLANLRNRFFT